MIEYYDFIRYISGLPVEIFLFVEQDRVEAMDQVLKDYNFKILRQDFPALRKTKYIITVDNREMDCLVVLQLANRFKLLINKHNLKIKHK